MNHCLHLTCSKKSFGQKKKKKSKPNTLKFDTSAVLLKHLTS